MVRYQFLSICYICGLLSFYPMHSAKAADTFEKMPPDSLTAHTVLIGETLYSLAKKYNTTIEAIRRNNPREVMQIQLGEVLRIPIGIIVPDAPPTLPDSAVHVVSPSETLYAIAQKYKITTEQLKTWNKLDSDVVKIGQTLVIKDLQKEQIKQHSPAPVKQAQASKNLKKLKKPVLQKH